MTSALILWSHAIVALVFGAATMRRGPATGLPRASLSVALGTTALWALAVSGIDGRDVAARVAESARDMAWLAFMLVLVRRGRVFGWGQVLVHGIAMLVAVAAAGLAVLASARPDIAVAVTATLVVLRMMTAASALVLARDLLAGTAGPARGGAGFVALALCGLWGIDLVAFSTSYLIPREVPTFIAARGMAMIPVGLLMVAGVRRGGDWTLTLSRTVAFRSVAAVAVTLYAGLVVLATAWAAAWGRAAQTGVVLGATVALVTLASTPWLRSWAAVMVSKHLFSHRFDYRAEWLRFADTLGRSAGRPGEDAAPLATRVVKAVAQMTGSPAGLLLLADGTTLVQTTAWAWEEGSAVVHETAQYLAQTHRIIALDDVRNDTVSPAEAAAVPQWMVDRQDAWALVPLLHADALVGAILLARPLVDRKLDWEDLDLLRVAGRQAASYLAEERAHTALADAQRFDEFNRRFAFILHDVKNLASQLSLVARNAERHADNPEFRADMVATLRSSADRMTALIGRLSPRTPRAEPARAIDLSALTARVAAERRAGHAVAALVPGPVWANAESGRLEQVLHHLIQNAAEASAATEPVVLSVRYEEKQAVIEVADRGCGMSAGFVRDQLFRPFASTKPGGFGIGAFEARQLVEAMGGRLEVASREGEGTRFRIVLPATGAMEAAA